MQKVPNLWGVTANILPTIVNEKALDINMPSSQDDKAIFRKASDRQNTKSSYVGKNANPNPKRFTASTKRKSTKSKNKY